MNKLIRLSNLFLLAVIISAIISCGSNDPNEEPEPECNPYGITSENWKYLYNDTTVFDVMTGKSKEIIKNQEVEVYRFVRYFDNKEAICNWLLYYDGKDFWFKSDFYMYPFIGKLYQVKPNCWLKFSICEREDYSHIDSVAEKITVIENGIPVEKEYYAVYEIKGEYSGDKNFTYKNKDLKCIAHTYKVKYFENLEGSIRSEFDDEFEVWFAKGYGITKIINKERTANLVGINETIP